ncbi:LamG domain-containing protein [bacterium]|nr:LamG domain-containing protein [bacterium]
MLYGYGVLNNHVPTLRATVMRGGSIGTSSLLTGLYAVYKGESNANDSLGTYNGTAQGGLTYSTGKSGNAFTFNGTNSYLLLPTNMFSTFTDDFSVNMWVNLQGIGTDFQTIFSSFYYDGVNLYGFIVYVFNSNLFFTIYNGTPTPVVLTYGVGGNYNAWTMFTVTRKASTRSRIYVNGTLGIADTSTTNPVYHASTTPTIGARRFDAIVQLYMSNGGKIDEVTPYSKELTSTELTDLYNAGTGKFYPTF